MNLFGYRHDLNGGRTTETLQWLATLAAQLPDDSRVAKKANPENAWSVSDYLLRQVEYSVRLLMWGLAGGDKSGPEPEPIHSPAEVQRGEDAAKVAEQMARTVASVFDLDV